MAQRFDPKLAISFHAVVEAGSITGGAAARRVTQPWMSEQVRKLEMQLGAQLLVRTSRSLALTDAGREFLPFARCLAEANEKAQVFATSLQGRQRLQLSIGACQYSVGIPERLSLIGSLIAREPHLKIDVIPGRTVELVESLLHGEHDLVIVHQFGVMERPGIEQVLLACRSGLLMMRTDDPLAAEAVVPVSRLAGRKLFVSPGNDDPVSMERSLKPLAEAGMEIVRCPDTERKLIESMAFHQRELCIKWHSGVPVAGTAGECIDGMVALPFEGGPIASPIALVRRAGEPPGRPVRLAWDIALEMASSTG
jgi:DNA-binding transcriptional LysR family regulator